MLAQCRSPNGHIGDWSWCGMFAVYCVKATTGVGDWDAAPKGFGSVEKVNGDLAKLRAANPEPGDVLLINSNNAHQALLAEKPSGDMSGAFSVVEGNVESQGIRESTRFTFANVATVYKPFCQPLTWTSRKSACGALANQLHDMEFFLHVMEPRRSRMNRGSHRCRIGTRT